MKKRCPKCGGDVIATYAAWDDRWNHHYASCPAPTPKIAPVEPANPQAETFPGTGRRGRNQGGTSPAANRRGARP